MIEFFKTNNKLSICLLLSILFFLRKGVQYLVIGSFVPLLIIIGLIIAFALSLQKGTFFIVLVKIWSFILIIWALVRILISTIHFTLQPFDGSFHMTQQFNTYNLVLSILMLVLGILMFRSINKKRLKITSSFPFE